MEVTHIIFDLDGTLIDSKNEIRNTYKQVMEELPPIMDIELEDIDYGAPLTKVLSAIYGEGSLNTDAARHVFARIYDQLEYDETYVYPDVYDILNKLLANNFKLHIATNKRLKPTLKILEKKNLYSLFTGVASSDGLPGPMVSKESMVEFLCQKHHIDKGYMVGDSPQDLEAGKYSNLTTIAAMYGYGNQDELLSSKPDFVISNFNEILNILLPAT